MGSIVERPSGGFQAKVRRVGHPAQYQTFATRAEAKRWIADVESDMRRGRYEPMLPVAGISLGEAIDTWAVDARVRLTRFDDAEKNRIDRLKTFTINLRSKPTGAEMRGKIVDIGLDRLTVDHIESLISDMVTAGYAGRTVIQYLSVIQRAWAHAMRRPVAMCPVAAARNKPSIGPGRTRRLEAGEEARLLESCSVDFQQVVLFALGTAARQSEISGIRWRDVDMARRAIILRDTKNGETRTLPLSPAMLELLGSMWRSEDHNDLVFGMTPEAMKRRMIRATRRARIQDLHFHDLRHEAISRFFEDTDLSDLEIASISGHKSMQMLRRYAHLRTHKLADRLAGGRRGAMSTG